MNRHDAKTTMKIYSQNLTLTLFVD